jgi:hypothetical protein
MAALSGRLTFFYILVVGWPGSIAHDTYQQQQSGASYCSRKIG